MEKFQKPSDFKYGKHVYYIYFDIKTSKALSVNS